jgi:hypothetical protein
MDFQKLSSASRPARVRDDGLNHPSEKDRKHGEQSCVEAKVGQRVADTARPPDTCRGIHFVPEAAVIPQSPRQRVHEPKGHEHAQGGQRPEPEIGSEPRSAVTAGAWHLPRCSHRRSVDNAVFRISQSGGDAVFHAYKSTRTGGQGLRRNGRELGSTCRGGKNASPAGAMRYSRSYPWPSLA